MMLRRGLISTALLFVVFLALASGTALRGKRSRAHGRRGAPKAQKHHVQHAAAAPPADATSRLSRLLADVDESVRKAGQDAELVFAQLYGYDHQLEASLEREIGLLNHTKERLAGLQEKFRSRTSRSASELQRLGSALSRSEKTKDHYQASSTQTGSKFDGLLKNVQGLVNEIREAAASPAGKGSLPQKSIEKIRSLLASHGDMQHRFQEVFTMLSVGKPSVDVAKAQKALTPIFLGRVVTALQEIASRLHKRRSGVLLQLQAREQQLSTVAAKAATRSDTARGAQAEGERKAEELAFSVAFTESVLMGDEAFLTKVQEHIKAKNELIDSVRTARKGQLTTLEDLVDLLKGRYSASDAPAVDASQDDKQALEEAAEDAAKHAAVSFLQVDADEAKPKGAVSALQTEIESSLNMRSKASRRASTHNILMRVKAALDHVAPIDTDTVRDVVAKMGSALRSVDTESAEADDAQRRCESQRFNAEQEDARLRGSLKLMSASQNHTNAAIQAAQRNLDGIASKAQVLNKSSAQFGKLVNNAVKTLDGQSRDRNMIMAAVRKAQEVAPRAAGKAAPATTALLSQLLNLLGSQDKGEKAYKKREINLQADLKEYTRGYEQLLSERRLHYERTLSALELYSSELSGDAVSRQAALSDDNELKTEGLDLCSSIIAFYKRHGERRQQLSTALRAVLPKVPDLLTQHLEVQGASDADSAVNDPAP
jgi:hypothetical protein